MAAKELISTITVGSGGASTIEFTSIPATYTDLQLVLSARQSSTSGGSEDAITFALNSSASSKTSRYLLGQGNTAYNYSYNEFYLWTPNSTTTANTFSNTQLYISNYSGSANKSISINGVTENNGTGSNLAVGAGLWSNTAAITSITLTPLYGNFVQYSTASLYGWTKGSGGATVS